MNKPEPSCMASASKQKVPSVIAKIEKQIEAISIPTIGRRFLSLLGMTLHVRFLR